VEHGNLYSLIERRMPADRAAACLRVPGGAGLSWRQLHDGSGRIAALLAALRLPSGSRLLVQVEKSPEALMLYLAALRAGLVYVPLNCAYQSAELQHFASDCEPAVVVCGPPREALMRGLAGPACRAVFTLDEHGGGSLMAAAAGCAPDFGTVARAGADPAAIVYTSGTTGRSKGAVLSGANLASNALTLEQFWGFRERREQGRPDVLLHALPLFHVHGLFVACHCALLSGSSMIFLPRFDLARVLEALPETTVMMGVPTFYTRLLEEPAFTAALCRSVRLFVSGSAPLLADTFEAFRRRTGHTLLERYGMSETLMLASNPYHGDPVRERIAGTVGPALPGVRIRIGGAGAAPVPAGEVGEVEVAGPNVFSGYWRQPGRLQEDFTPDGFFRTGDLGCLGAPGTPPGYLTLVGRSKDLIITGGFNVYPKEIEGWLDALPGIVESAVVGLPHPDFGEAVCAFVVMAPDAALDEDGLVAGLKARIAGFKVPKRIWALPQLPRNSMGKVQKKQLREQYARAFHT
jgi:malonyl-CoA/methylmalonyl-CoA synthetase